MLTLVLLINWAYVIWQFLWCIENSSQYYPIMVEFILVLEFKILRFCYTDFELSTLKMAWSAVFEVNFFSGCTFEIYSKWCKNWETDIWLFSHMMKIVSSILILIFSWLFLFKFSTYLFYSGSLLQKRTNFLYAFLTVYLSKCLPIDCSCTKSKLQMGVS